METQEKKKRCSDITRKKRQRASDWLTTLKIKCEPNYMHIYFICLHDVNFRQITLCVQFTLSQRRVTKKQLNFI